ncbi:MAG: hypothetical protein AAB443_01905 [Patescibacteria group bacterium]
MKTPKIILLMVALLVIVVLGINYFLSSNAKIDLNNPPKFIQADFIDLDKIYSISKFRSGSGHDFSGNGETCRSMKHYFNTQDTQEKFDSWDGGTPPPPTLGKEIDIFSPVDGEIISVENNQNPIGSQVYIVPNNAQQFKIRLFHIYLLPQLKQGSQVKAGQKIGVISTYQNTDIAISAGFLNRTFISYFQVMPDSIFAKYQTRGVGSRNEFIITKEERNSNPLTCKGEQFVGRQNNPERDEDFVRLSGWEDPNQNSK